MPLWEALGLSEMSTDSEGEVWDSGGSCGASTNSESSVSSDEQAKGSLFRTRVSDTCWKMSLEWETESSVSGDWGFSTDVSDTCRAEASRWEQRGNQEAFHTAQRPVLDMLGTAMNNLWRRVRRRICGQSATAPHGAFMTMP